MKTKIIAHRGASKYEPENTMRAFKLAFNQGADGIETDVQLTKDNIPILMHDEKVNRTTDGKGYIKDYTYKELQKLNIRSKNNNDSDIHIPRLDEFLKWVSTTNLYINIELKNDLIFYENLERIVLNMVKAYNLEEHITLSSFNPDSIKIVRQLDSEIDLALITSAKKRTDLKYMNALGINAIHVKYCLLNEAFMKKFHAVDIPVRTYTINRPKHMKRCYTLACAGIFTDDVPRAQDIRQRR